MTSRRGHRPSTRAAVEQLQPRDWLEHRHPRRWRVLVLVVVSQRESARNRDLWRGLVQLSCAVPFRRSPRKPTGHRH